MERSNQHLWDVYAANRTDANRNAIVEAYIPWAKKTARRLSRLKPMAQGMIDKDDIFIEVCLGLMRAVERFDLDREVQFTTFARYHTLNRVRDLLRKNGFMPKKGAYRPLLSLDNNFNESEPMDVVDTRVENPAAAVEKRDLVDWVQSKMYPRERRIMHDLFLKGRTLKEVGKDLGVSRQRVGQRIDDIRARMMRQYASKVA